MALNVRFVGQAASELQTRGLPTEASPLPVSPELVHLHDQIRHPLFPGRALYVVAREVDLIERSVTVVLDLVPAPGKDDSPFPFTPSNIDD